MAPPLSGIDGCPAFDAGPNEVRAHGEPALSFVTRRPTRRGVLVLARVESAGLTVERQDVLVLLNPAFGPRTFSAGVVQLIASFVPDRCGVTDDEAEAWLADLQDLGARGEYFFSVNRYLFLARRIDPS